MLGDIYLMLWIVESYKPFDRIDVGNDDKEVLSRGNERASVIFESQSESFRVVAKKIEAEYPQFIPKGYNGPVEVKIAGRSAYLLSGKIKDKFYLFYPWSGKYIISNGVPANHLLDTLK